MSRDAHELLIRTLLARAGTGGRLAASRQRPWASITFEGARHVVEIDVPAEANNCFLEGIEDAEFDLAGHLLADLAVVAREPIDNGFLRVRIEALTLVGD